ncbi:MAG TPA: nuclear transport factor 2 family protein [Sporichthya sp.]|nr:nuclear transport factor 2 family protein [Sporichthya sp.]
MSTHPNVTVVDEMTQAIFGHDRDKLATLFTEDLAFHVRGALPINGDYHGVDGLLSALGKMFELTGGNIKLDQLFCVGTGDWAAEWEQAALTVDGRTLEINNGFIYRFEGARIAEMWFLSAAPAESVSFWS